MDQKPIPSKSLILIKPSAWVKGHPLLIGSLLSVDAVVPVYSVGIENVRKRHGYNGKE